MIPDFSKASDFAEILGRLVQAARSIMMDHELVYRDTSWGITALELYLYTASNVWRDCTTHRSPAQAETGNWYVHCYKNGNFRAPQYSGIDITAGSRNGLADEVTYAGLLIRELDSNDGSAKAFQSIVRGKYLSDERRWTDEERQRIREIHGTGIKSGPLRLVSRSTPKTCQLWIGPRKLSTKRPEAERFKHAHLRVATWRTRLHYEKMVAI